ncbi:tyrosine-type recombinase/integrase [Methylolobus aquaticus]
MSKKRTTRGLRKRGETWHIQKTICGQLVCESTGTSDLTEAERYLALRMEEIRRTTLYGERKGHSLEEAAARYLTENAEQRGIARQGYALRPVVDWFGGEIRLGQLNGETLQPYVQARLAQVSTGTVVRELGALKAVLRKAASVWRDTNGVTWLERAPDMPSVKVIARKPRPITWQEQEVLFKQLPDYLACMALFAVNTGCRDQEICGLRWEWEHAMDDRSVFILPETITKNGEEKMVPLNRIAQSVVDAERGKSNDWVFTYRGHRIDRMNNRAWKMERAGVELSDVRVHDLRHTFAVRLRDAGLPMEDIQDLLGHKRRTVTHHYSRATLERLFHCVDLLTNVSNRPSAVLRRVYQAA